MKIKEVYRNTIKHLSTIYSEGESTAITRLLFEEMGVLSTPFKLDEERYLTQNEDKWLSECMNRLSKKEPIQYILGFAWFNGKKFFVSESCLIPRQETEQLIEIIAKSEKEFGGKILDIGTGSGCIAISLSIEMPAANVWASDVSAGSLSLAKKNIEKYETKISLIHDDILEADKSKYPESIDIIVSNPPYIRNMEKEKMHPNVLEFEPHLALFVNDNDPLLFYRKITNFAIEKLKKEGKLYFEINEAFGKEVTELLDSSGFGKIQLIKDIHGKDRFIASVYEQ